jgi:hypothetical protein
MNGLSSATRIGMIGDLHGDIGALLTIAQALREHDVTVLVAVSDVGLLWPGENWSNNLTKVAKRLASSGQTLCWVDGNHEDHHRLGTFPVDAGGLRRLRPNLIHLPRGYRTSLDTGKTLAALGGANSIDFERRKDGVSWWAEESITDADLDTLGDTHADILIGHDAPLDLPSLDGVLTQTDRSWSTRALAYAEEGRRKFHQGFIRVSPSLYIGGHYHLPIDEVVGYFDDRHGFPTRVVLLDEVQGTGASCAILDLDTLGLDYFTSTGRALPAKPAQVTELTIGHGGRWLLDTIGSRHILDLDRRTIERLPGPDASPSTSDAVHCLRTLDVCRLGEPGRWTMKGGYLVDYYWHVSSIIRHIHRMPSLTDSPVTSSDRSR